MILVVEDDEDVRALVNATLGGDMGYHVIPTSGGSSALEILHSDQHIDLLFTDVVMPGGMSGLQLAEHAHDCRPELPIMLTSGYNEEFISAKPAVGANLPLIRKPFRRSDLGDAIASLLKSE